MNKLPISHIGGKTKFDGLGFLMTILAFVSALLSGCHTPRTVAVHDLTERYDKCGLSVLPPQVPNIRYFPLNSYPGLYNTICDRAYTARRSGWHMDFSFGVRYIWMDDFFAGLGSLKEEAESYLRRAPIKYEHDLEKVRVEDSSFLGLAAIRYEEVRVATYEGDYGNRSHTFGYFLPHPDNPHWVINAYYVDSYSPRLGEGPDYAMRGVGESFLNSIRRIPLKEDEKTGRARDRELQNWGF